VTDETVTIPSERAPGRDAVSVRLPASGAYLSVLRTATAGLAARLDFTIDEIEDLRIAVDEACAMLLQDAVPGAELTCDFTLSDELMRISVKVQTAEDRLPSKDTFAWTVLSALAGEVDATRDADGVVTMTLAKRRAGRSA
jgi:serine/threonine-protein kinase RsbW